jgi:hypothetical protein
MHKLSNIHRETVAGPVEMAAAKTLREQFDRNSAWLQQHLSEVYAEHRGKFICVAGEQLFVGATASEAIAKAIAVHGDEQGWFTRYIPREKVTRIYAH